MVKVEVVYSQLDFNQRYELIKARSGEFLLPFEYKILTADEAGLATRDLKKEGRKVVLASGIFDLMHPGHLEFLSEAKKLGDVLAVTTPTDEQIQEYKNPQRPIVTLENRLKMLGSLEYVDFVFPQNSWFTMEVLQKILPSIFAYVNSPENSHMLSQIQAAKTMGIELQGITLDTSIFSSSKLVELIEKLK